MAESDRYVWMDDEVRTFLNIIFEKNVTTILDGKHQRNAQIFQEVRAELILKGYDKPWTILRNKWKSLKQKYMAEKRKLGRSGAGGKSTFRYFDDMDRILGQRPIVTSLSSNINSGMINKLFL